VILNPAFRKTSIKIDEFISFDNFANFNHYVCLRQIVSLTKLDVCATLENFHKYPLLEPVINLLNGTFPGLVQKCPYKVKFLLFCREISKIYQKIPGLQHRQRLT
jgi:hypothetical protein